MVEYSHLLKNFPQLVVIHIVKGFKLFNETDVLHCFVLFLEFSCFFYDLTDIGNLISVPLPFLNPIWTSESSQFTYCWSLTWKIFSSTFLACEMSVVVGQFEHSLALSFFGIGMKTDVFQSCGYSWVFQICSRMVFIWFFLKFAIIDVNNVIIFDTHTYTHSSWGHKNSDTTEQLNWTEAFRNLLSGIF